MTRLSAWMQCNAEQRCERIAPFFAGTPLLDVGSAEGWVGLRAARRHRMRVQLLDVVDLDRSGLPHVCYDGTRLPFPDRSFATVTLLLTLHHCRDPELTLREAARVAQQRIIIITESVYRTRFGKALLQFVDGGFNRLRSSGRMLPAVQVRTVAAWRRSIARCGCRIRAEGWLSRGVHLQRLFVLDAPP